MHLPPLHELCVAAAPTGTPVPDTEDLLAVWAAHTNCNICMGVLALNPSAVDGEDGTPWRGPPGSKAWVVVCATGRGHAYHKQCIQERRRAFPDAKCPECQQPIVDYGEDVPLPPSKARAASPRDQSFHRRYGMPQMPSGSNSMSLTQRRASSIGRRAPKSDGSFSTADPRCRHASLPSV